jgi:chromosome segregation ATPase
VDTDAIVIEWHRMQAQLQETREELEQYSLDHGKAQETIQSLEQERDALNSRLTEATEAREKLQGESKDLQEENELLLLQLHQVQEELEQYYLENLDHRKYREQVSKVREEKRHERTKHEDRLAKEKAARERDAKKHRIQMLKRDVREFETSNAWRLTAPLRFVSRLITLRWRRRPALDLSGSPDDQIRVLEQHLDALHRAGTWRMTAPIRALGRLVRRA